MSFSNNGKRIFATAGSSVNIALGFDGNRTGEVIAIKGKSVKVRFLKPVPMLECPNCKSHKHIKKATEGDMRYRCTNTDCENIESAKGALHPIVKTIPRHQLVLHED